ncbi:MAG: hypothetical protein K8H86_03570 [Ignavibacteriaceae bacterium]|nr:hypothetical protein [Ignavibacteriaceae bacterium]
MRFRIALLFTLLLSTLIPAQEAGNWKVYSDMKNTYDAVEGASGIWAASSGGAFFYSPAANNYKTLNKSDGLSGSLLTASVIDKNGNIWFGSQNGMIDVYNPVTNKVNTIFDIFNSDRTQKQINELKVKGDTIIVSTDFGISLIDAHSFLFFDTFFKLGSFQSFSRVKSSVMFNLFYAATDNGLAVQKPGTTNLSAPESWNVFSTADGLPSKNVLKIIEYKNEVIVATDKGFAKFNNSILSPFLPELTGKSISDILPVGDSLFILNGDTIKVFVNNLLSVKTFLNTSVKKLLYGSGGLMGVTSKGILMIETGALLFPNGPAANQFPSIAVDPAGNFWSASGKDGRGVGFYKYDGNKWTTYNSGNSSFTLNDFYKIYAAPDNTVYAGTWGAGFVSIKDDSIKVYNYLNTDMEGLYGSPQFLVITGFGMDSKNNTWILNYASNNHKNLSMITPDSSWYHFVHPTTPAPLVTDQYLNLVLDQYDTKWFNGITTGRTGLYYFNENKTYDNTEDDKYGFINEGSGLLSNSISSVVVDKRGDVWVGSNSGVNIITNTGTILSSSTQNPPIRISSVFSLRQQAITCIAVDPLNRKWIGTNQGLLLVSVDGTQINETYTSSNSPLPADKIVSLAVDETSGKIFVGTDEGLAVFETNAQKPVTAFTELFIFPNPYKLNNNSGELTIDGLVKESDIKVLTINGKLIKEFSSPGGRVAYWDGRDELGKLVSSGIYLIVAFDKEGNNITTSKVAVLRQ